MRLFDKLHDHAHSAALLDDSGRVVSYGDLIKLADEVGAAVPRRSLVLILCSNTVDAVVGYVGLARAKHVCMMASSATSLERVEELVRAFRPNYIFGSSATVTQIDDNVVATIGDFVLAQISVELVPMIEELALLMSTSGSTGSPLMVRQSYSNVRSNADAIAMSLDLQASDRAITTLPMNYTYGLSIIHSQLHVGGSLVMSDLSLTHRDFWKTIETCRPTYFGGVPYTYQILDRLGIKRLAGSAIRMLTQAGGRLAPELAQKIHSECRKLGIEFHIMYGQTEATARMSVLHSNEVPSRPDSIGKPLSGGRFRVLHLESNQPMGPGEVGELEYSGSNVALGYAESSQDLLKRDEWNGVLHTGDLAKMDESGYVFVVGRRRRFIKLFGSRVSLDHVESHLSSLGIVAACGSGDDVLKVYVEGDENSVDVVREVASFVGVHPTGIEVVLVESLPRTDSGKVEYSRLERLK